MRQGEVYKLNLDYTVLGLEAKRRPYLVISYDAIDSTGNYVTVLPMRTLKKSKDKWLWEVKCTFQNRRSAIICDKIVTVPRYVFNLKSSEYVGTVSKDILLNVKDKVKQRLRI